MSLSWWIKSLLEFDPETVWCLYFQESRVPITSSHSSLGLPMCYQSVWQLLISANQRTVFRVLTNSRPWYAPLSTPESCHDRVIIVLVILQIFTLPWIWKHTKITRIYIWAVSYGMIYKGYRICIKAPRIVINLDSDQFCSILWRYLMISSLLLRSVMPQEAPSFCLKVNI